MTVSDLLPKNIFDIGGDALAAWIRENSKEEFLHVERILYSEEELHDMEHQSSACGREILRLEYLQKQIKHAIHNGNAAEMEITIPITAGTKALKAQRSHYDECVDRGYSESSYRVFGFPHFDGKMYYLNAQGELVPDRTRPLSLREQEKFGLLLFKEQKNG
jgi:hypothetical protein